MISIVIFYVHFKPINGVEILGNIGTLAKFVVVVQVVDTSTIFKLIIILSYLFYANY